MSCHQQGVALDRLGVAFGRLTAEMNWLREERDAAQATVATLIERIERADAAPHSLAADQPREPASGDRPAANGSDSSADSGAGRPSRRLPISIFIVETEAAVTIQALVRASGALAAVLSPKPAHTAPMAPALSWPPLALSAVCESRALVRPQEPNTRSRTLCTVSRHSDDPG